MDWGCSVEVGTFLGVDMALITPLVRDTGVSPYAAALHYSGEFPCFPGARVFITKVPRGHKRYLRENFGFFQNGNIGGLAARTGARA